MAIKGTLYRHQRKRARFEEIVVGPPGSLVTITGTEIGFVDGVTAGTVTASKAVVVDANKDASALRNLGVVNLDAGSSGTAGSVDVFPATAAKGKLAITSADQTGDTTVTLTTAAMAAARTVTIPDPGGAASFVMTEGAQTVNGAKTMTGFNVITHADNGLKLRDSDNSHGITVQTGNEVADRVLSIPVLGAADTIVTTGTAQTIAGAKTFSGANVYSGDGTITGSIQNTNTTAVTAATGGSIPVLTFTDGLNLVSFTTNADDIVHLPTNVAGDIGKEIEVYAVQGFELRSDDASATLNNVIIGATNEAAFVAGTYARLKCVADNTWLSVMSTTINGTHNQIVPDAV